MSLGSDTAVVNGQRFTTPTTAAYLPTAYGPQTTGVPNVSPTMPPFIGGQASATSTLGVETVGGYGTAGNNALATTVAGNNAFNPRVSPVIWAVLGLIVGLLALKWIHWRDTTLGGFEESAHAGSARESAEASV